MGGWMTLVLKDLDFFLLTQIVFATAVVTKTVTLNVVYI